MKQLSIFPFAILFFIAAAGDSYAQKNSAARIDSLFIVLKSKQIEDTSYVTLLNELSWELKGSKPDTVVVLGKRAIAIAKRISFRRGAADAYFNVGLANKILENYPSALSDFATAADIYQQIGDNGMFAIAYDHRGVIYKRQGNLPEALKNYFTAIEIFERIKDNLHLAKSRINVGNIYRSQSAYGEALKNYYAALTIMMESKNEEGVALCHKSIGLIYTDQGNFEEALKNFAAAFETIKRTGSLEDVAALYDNLGSAYRGEGNYPEAIKNYFIALEISDSIGDKDGIVFSNIFLGNTYLSLKDYKRARKYMNAGFQAAQKGNSVENLKNCYRELYKLDSITANWKDAFLNHLQYKFYLDSVINEEKSKKLMAEQMQYDFDKKDAAVKAEQDKKDAVATVSIRKQKQLKNIFIGGFGVVVLFSAVVYRQRNRISKEKERSDELLLNILPSEVAEELKKKGSAEAKHFDNVTVLFTDFMGFTHLSERLSPKQLVSELDNCFKAFDGIMGKYAIEKIKTVGDAYLAVSGLPAARPRHAEDVVNAAIEIRDFMLQRKKQVGDMTFDIRIGVHSGNVVAGIVGVKKFAYDIWGDTVNTAARMEQNSEAGKINISESTYALVKDKFDCIYRGKIAAKNKGELSMYFVSSASGLST